jgi:hypothetical protein
MKRSGHGNAFHLMAIVVITLGSLHAEDFTLKHFAFGDVITVHTTLSPEGLGARLMASARNESGVSITHAKICILSAALQTGCLFELWNTKLWAPGEELSWNMTTSVRVSNFAHRASLLEFEEDNTSPQPLPQRQSLKTSPVQKPQSTNTPGAETLTNDTVIKLAKAGLGDDVMRSASSSVLLPFPEEDNGYCR